METRALIRGVETCGGGKWADIKRLGLQEIVARTPVDLKDKWRNLLRVALLSPEEIRLKKVSIILVQQQGEGEEKRLLHMELNFFACGCRLIVAKICHPICCGMCGNWLGVAGLRNQFPARLVTV